MITQDKPTTEVDGIMFCRTHDDFAIEGYDWSDVCHTWWCSEDTSQCDLVPMFVEVGS